LPNNLERFLQIQLQHISKHFGNEKILHNVNMKFRLPEKIALIGNNGSGKSTLLQIIAGYMLPSKGTICFKSSDKDLADEEIYTHVSYCAPYLELIEELTLKEFLEFHFSFKKSSIAIEKIIQIIGLESSIDKPIEKFSSGMKQRVKLAQAIFSDCEILLLDEPCSNLDQEGIDLYKTLIQLYGKNKLVIVASNDLEEYDFCERKISVLDFKI
jgi:ABC-type multidrug transport system ATPase subunit